MKKLMYLTGPIALGIWIAVTDAHRLAIAAAWPYLVDFWSYYIAF